MGNNSTKVSNLKTKLENFFIEVTETLIIFVAIIIGLKIAFNSRTPVVTVPTKSMYPVIKPGDILFVEGWDVNSIKPGDIIVYLGYDPIKYHRWIYIVHRVVKIVKVNGKEYVITAGDNNIRSICLIHDLPKQCCYDVSYVKSCPNVIKSGFYPPPGLPLKKCPVFGEPKGFCIVGKVIMYNNTTPLKIPYIGKYLPHF